ncbi:sigma-70 family RNA polymerase sigma factor [Rubrivirga sp. IMCC45206]|uniref:sigma-70 family RNA polymerase sigma factor n=1 Tax=Rubrivirga sp. IMCC45206 TaxID=3391614 RepID=UPI0039903074
MTSPLQPAVERYVAERDADGPRADDYARAVAVAALPLVRSLARRVTLPDHPLASYPDLENAGMLGMLQALGSYDPARGTPFASFAYGRIRGSLVDFLRTIDCLSRDRRRRVAEANRTAQTLQQELGDEPRAAQVADRLGVSVRSYNRLLGDAQQRFALSLFDGQGTDRPSPIDTIPALDVEHADAHTERRSMYDFVGALVERLPEREQRIVHLYFFEGLTLREIAGEFHLTEARISQILSKTLRTLRGRMAEHAVAA